VGGKQICSSKLVSETKAGDDARCTASSSVDAVLLRLFIVSGVRLVREGLVRSLRRRNGVIVLGAVDFSPEAIACIVPARPDVIAIDLANAEGLDAARRLRVQSPVSKLVAFAVAEVEEEVFACAAAGFSGYVTREATADDLLRAVVDAHNGRMNCAPHIAAAMFARLSRMPSESGPADNLRPLTAREHEILALSEKGWSNKEIARELRISASSVKNHIHNILQKMQVRRRGQAAARYRSSRVF
jgi:DNA-binding NarL/FixJ family response regulator